MNGGLSRFLGGPILVAQRLIPMNTRLFAAFWL